MLGGLKFNNSFLSKNKNDDFLDFAQGYSSPQTAMLSKRMTSYPDSVLGCENFVKKVDNINYDKFCRYIDKFDFQKLHTISPATKEYDTSQMLLLLDFFYKKRIKKFDSETLKYKGDFTKLISKNYFNRDKLNDFFSIFPLTQRNIGQIPSVWLDNIPKKEQKKTQEAVFEAISKFSKDLQFKKPFFDVDAIQNKTQLENLEEELSKNLKKTVSVKKLENGNYGTGFRLSCGNQNDLCLKIFKPTHFSDNFINKIHGRLIEPQTGMFLNKHSDEFAKEFFGQVALKGEKSGGFLVTQFLDDEIIPEKSKKIIKSFNITCRDAGEFHNRINGKIIDFGFVEVTKKPLKKVFDKIFNCIKGYSKYYIAKK